jgi:hypothetical protein
VNEQGRKVVVGPEAAASCLDSEACPASLLVYYLSSIASSQLFPVSTRTQPVKALHWKRKK